MLYFLIIIIGVIFLFIAVADYDVDSGWGLLAAVFIAIAVVLSICMIYTYSTADAHKAELKQEYKALAYKCESDEARDERGFLNKEYIDEIENWNTTLAFNKGICRNFWLGIFYPNIYDNLDYIDYGSIRYKQDE